MLQQKGFFCSRFFRTNSIVSSICVALCVKNVFSVCLFICGVLLFSWPLESQKETLWVWLVSFSWCVLTMMMICVCIFFVYSALGAHAYWPCCHCSIHPFWANHINFRQFQLDCGIRSYFIYKINAWHEPSVGFGIDFGPNISSLWTMKRWWFCMCLRCL